MKQIILTTVIICVFCISTAFADQQEHKQSGPMVLPMNISPFGQSYQKWAADFARWTYSIPSDINPSIAGNLNCTQPQYGKVWFVSTGTIGPNVKCEVPEGKGIFLQLGAYIDTYPCPDPNFQPAPGQTLEQFLTLDAKNIVDYDTNVAHIMPSGLMIDNKVVISQDDAFKRRVASKLFSLTGDLSLKTTFDACITGAPQKAVTDGYWAMIVGLQRGKHTFTFTGGASMEVTVVKD